ncbi:MAG: SDR family NAD(P)-dependent oxidoreductase [Acidobacteriota bacterium]
MNMQGNTILITGGGSGIGRGLAEAFHKLGNQVIIGGRRREVLEKTAAANPGMGFVVLDTTSTESIRAAAADVVQRYPALNVIVNNAGVQKVFDFAKPESINGATVREEVGTNILGPIDMVTAFLPHLLQQPKAAIVNLSSGLAFMPIALYPVYCATKAFVHSFTMSLRHQLRNTSVRVIELAPPWVKTELDAAHETPTTHEGMIPMPLSDFITAAMADLATDREELPVAGAKFLYAGGVSEKAAEVFARINH